MQDLDSGNKNWKFMKISKRKNPIQKSFDTEINGDVRRTGIF